MYISVKKENKQGQSRIRHVYRDRGDADACVYVSRLKACKACIYIYMYIYISQTGASKYMNIYTQAHVYIYICMHVNKNIYCILYIHIQVNQE